MLDATDWEAIGAAITVYGVDVRIVEVQKVTTGTGNSTTPRIPVSTRVVERTGGLSP